MTGLGEGDGEGGEFHRTAQDWARLSGFGYRSILAAIKLGELEAYQLNGGGRYMVSSRAFEAWKESLKVRPQITPEEPKPQQKKQTQSRDIAEFALHQVNLNNPFK